MKAKTDQEACDLLDRLVIASPCSVPWESMTGDARKRLCGGCSRYVHNISDMSRRQAEEFLEKNGTTHCMIFYRRFDGTIMTDDCPVGLRKIRNACRFAYRVAASFFVMLISLPQALAQQTDKEQANNVSQSVKKGETAKRVLHMVDDNWKEPVPPPGFEYQGNPAGGGMILRPIKGTQPMPMPGAPAVIQPITGTKPGKPMLVHPVKSDPSAVSNPPQHVVETEPANVNLDTTAHTFYNKGQEAMHAGKKTLANFYFEKALDAFDNQKGGDAKFRNEIERAFKASN